MAITPNSKVYLCNVPLDNLYTYTVTFSSRNAQSSYFLGTVISGGTFDKIGYQRKDGNNIGYLRVPSHYDNIVNANYVVYQNTNYSSRYFYAFITRKVYNNNNETFIYIETDVWQTWQFDVTIGKSYVIREHVNQFLLDRPNIYTVAESVDYGNDYYIYDQMTLNADNPNNLRFLLTSTVDLTADAGTVDQPKIVGAKGLNFDRVPNATDFYIIGRAGSTIQQILQALADVPWVAQNIQALTWIPNSMLTNVSTEVVESALGFTIERILTGESVQETVLNVGNVYEHFPSYNEAKLYFYPYSFVELSVYNGTTLILKPECMRTPENLNISCQGVLSSEPRLVYYPIGYNAPNAGLIGEQLNVALQLGSFPQFPIANDNYILYLANNANSLKLANAIAEFNTGYGGITGGIAGALGGDRIGGKISDGGGFLGATLGGIAGAFSGSKSSIESVYRQMAQAQDAQLRPPSLSGQSGGELFNVAKGYTGLQIKFKTIKTEYRDILEEYFYNFGYKVNRYKIPNMDLYHDYFNFVQMSDPVVTGAIDEQDKVVIKRMFSNGVKLYKSPYYIGVY